MPRRMNRECNQVRHDKAHGIQAPTADHPSDVALDERAITPERADDAKKARDSLSQLIMNKNVTLQNVKNEKYGRILADVYLDELHLNKWMIDQSFAVAYDGKTKDSPSSWSEYYDSKNVK